MSLIGQRRPQKLYLDSGCSHHMMGERSMFLDLQPLKGGTIAFGGNQQGHIAGIGKVGKKHHTTIENVFYVKGLKHNLLSISQFCDSEYSVSFDKDSCVIKKL